MDGEVDWGVTAVQTVEELDAGPIWGSRTFPVHGSPRKSDLYNGAVTDAALQLIHEVVAKAADPAFVAGPLDYARPEVPVGCGPRCDVPTAPSTGPTRAGTSCERSGRRTARPAYPLTCAVCR
jgi:hypothetical protein